MRRGLTAALAWGAPAHLGASIQGTHTGGDGKDGAGQSWLSMARVREALVEAHLWACLLAATAVTALHVARPSTPHLTAYILTVVAVAALPLVVRALRALWQR